MGPGAVKTVPSLAESQIHTNQPKPQSVAIPGPARTGTMRSAPEIHLVGTGCCSHGCKITMDTQGTTAPTHRSGAHATHRAHRHAQHRGAAAAYKHAQTNTPATARARCPAPTSICQPCASQPASTSIWSVCFWLWLWLYSADFEHNHRKSNHRRVHLPVLAGPSMTAALQTNPYKPTQTPVGELGIQGPART